MNKNDIIERIEVDDKQIAEVNHEIIQVQDYEVEVIQEDVKEIKKFIKKRKRQIKNYYLETEKGQEIVNSLEKSDGLNIFAINKYLFEPLLKPSRCVKQYSEIEILIVLEFYQEQMLEINKKTMFPPQLEQYCRLLGISTTVFKKQYINSNNDELRNAAQQVVDYIASGLSFAGMTRQVDSTSQIFAQRSSLNRQDKEKEEKQESNVAIAVIDADDFRAAVANLTTGFLKK